MGIAFMDFILHILFNAARFCHSRSALTFVFSDIVSVIGDLSYPLHMHAFYDSFGGSFDFYLPHLLPNDLGSCRGQRR